MGRARTRVSQRVVRAFEAGLSDPGGAHLLKTRGFSGPALGDGANVGSIGGG